MRGFHAEFVGIAEGYLSAKLFPRDGTSHLAADAFGLLGTGEC
jgi:hypothetical protein